MLRDPVAAARNVVNERYGGAICAFARGDWQRKEETPYSVLSMVVILGQLPRPYRESLRIGQNLVEVYVHDAASWEALTLQKDRLQGDATVVQIMAQGEPLLPGNASASEMQARAKAVFAAGPEPLQDAQIKERRYNISMLLNDLRAPRSHGEAMGSLSVLHESLADLYLRGRGLWSASGAAIPKALQLVDADLARRWQRAFTTAFMGDRRDIMGLVDEVLEPYGGLLFDGYIRRTPESSRSQATG